MTETPARGSAAAVLAQFEKAATTMWHDEFARIVIEQFARNPTLTLEDLRRALEARLADDSADRIAKAKCRGALEALRA